MGYRSWYGLVMSGSYTTPLGQTYRLTVEDAPAEADVDVLPHALEAYNESRWPQHPPWRPLAIFVRDDARIVASRVKPIAAGYS